MRTLLYVGATLALSACSITPYNHKVIESAMRGDAPRSGALAEAELAKDRNSTDAAAYRLDLAMARLAAGDLTGAIDAMADGLEALEKVHHDNAANIGVVSWSEHAATLITDQSAMAYDALDHERLAANALLALLCEIAGRPDAVAYAQTAQKRFLGVESARGGVEQTTGEDVAGGGLTGFVEFICALLNEDGRAGNLNAARQLYEASYRRQRSASAEQALARINGSGSAAGTYPVWVFLVEGPAFRRTEENMFLGVAAENAVRVVLELIFAKGKIDHLLVPTLRFPVAKIEPVQTGIAGVAVAAADGDAHSLDAFDLSGHLQADFEGVRTAMIVVAAARRVFKEASKQGLKSVVDDHLGKAAGGPWLKTAFDALAELWKAAEKADLRGWALAPSRIHAVRLELAPGQHELTLSLRGDRGAVRIHDRALQPVGEDSRTVRIDVQGDTTFVLAVAPAMGALGQLITNRPAAGGAQQ